MASICLAVEVPTTCAAFSKWALTSSTKLPNCCFSAETVAFTCRINSVKSCCCSSKQFTEALDRQMSAMSSEALSTRAFIRRFKSFICSMTVSVRVLESCKPCIWFSTTNIRVSNSSRSLASLSRFRSIRSVEYRRNSVVSSRDWASWSPNPFTARKMLAVSPPFLSSCCRRAVISPSCALRRLPTSCSCVLRSLSHAASSPLNPSTMPKSISASSLIFLRSFISVLCLSMPAIASRSLLSRMPCFLIVGSSSSREWCRSLDSISAASTRKAVLISLTLPLSL
mmetsp:Transcript_133330/g.242944  ORF Transcript_133330/g.242944 Transcript_133330/m.242944 type:complete len:283 (+) Transcript_133330:796-1644(+)